jgi:transposase InsO family protein
VIGEGAKLYLAAILDLLSRFVVGWAISAVNDRRLTLKALEMAIQRRCPIRVSCTTPTVAARTRPGSTKRISRPGTLRAA